MSYDALIKRIDKLNSISTIIGSNLIPVFVQSQDQTMKSTVSNLSDYIQSIVSVNFSTFISQPVTGFTYTGISSTEDNVWLILSPLATIATLTVVLPQSPVDQQEIEVNTTQEVTALTLSADPSSSIVGIGIPVTISQFSFFKLRYDISTTTWYRVG